jgi:hypothetical protein
MASVGRLVEAVACAVDGGWSGPRGSGVLHLHAYGAFEDVADDGAGMAVRLGGLTRSVTNANDLNVQMISPKRGKRL